MRISIELDLRAQRPNGTVQVKLVLFRGTRSRYSTGIYVDPSPSKWDKAQRRVRFNAANASDLNERIAADVARAESIAAKRPTITPEALRSELQRPRITSASFVSIARADLKALPPKSEDTRETRRRVLDLFEGFDPAITVQDIDTITAERFEAHLRSKGIGANGAVSYMTVLRTLYHRACKVARVRPVPNVLEDVNTTVVYREPPVQLDAAEVERMIRFAEDPGTKPHLAKVAHMWLFSFFFAGLRWTDLCLLRTSDIEGGGIDTTQHKTDKGKRVGMHPYAAKIATLYRQGEYVFGIAGSDRPTRMQIIGARTLANRHLKSIAIACGIPKRLHTHCARHTFAAQAMDADVDDRAIWTAIGISPASYKHYKGKLRPERVDAAIAPVFDKYK